MRTSANRASGGMIVALIGALNFIVAAAPVAALAQDAAAPPPNPTDATPAPADSALSPDDSAVLDKALIYDPATFANTKPAKSPRLPGLSIRPGLDASRTDKPDGSSTVVVQQPLPAEWDAKLGADLASTSPDSARPYKPLARTDPGAGAAWASLGVPNLATVDARVDPSNDQGKLGTTLKHSIPVGGKFAVTLQNSYSVTETFGPPAAASDVPLMTAPPISATQPAPQVGGQVWGQTWGQAWGNEKAAKFDILPTGTTFGAKFASNSNDPVSHKTLSAEQKLYGPLQVTTALTDVGQPTSSKSITAGFKLKW
jgi:hypothetical protein